MMGTLDDLELSELSGALPVMQELERLARGGALLDLLFINKGEPVGDVIISDNLVVTMK